MTVFRRNLSQAGLRRSVHSLATLAVLGLSFFSAVLAVGFIENGYILCLEQTVFFTLTIIFVRLLQLFSAVDFFSLWTFCTSGSHFRGV